MRRRAVLVVAIVGWLGCADGGERAEGPTTGATQGSTAPATGDESSSSDQGTASESTASTGADGSSSDDGAASEFDPAFALEQVDIALAAGVPGLAIAIVYDGEVVMAEGFGVADELGTAVDPTTLFNVASLTKMVTALTVLTERDEGLVMLDAPVPSVVPEFLLREGFDPSSVQIRHLLTHSSGLGDWWNDPYTAGYTLLEEFSGNPEQPLWFTPGTIFDYSNRGFTLAGLVAARLHGGSFADAVQARVLTPLGMDGATVDAAVAQQRVHARGDSSWDGGWVGPEQYVGEWYEPSGGLWVGADDLGALLIALAHESADGIADGTIAELGSPVMPTHEYPGAAYGYGLFVDTNEPRSVYHAGSTGGYLADIEVVPSKGFGVAIVVNSNVWEPGQAGFAIFEHYAGPVPYSDDPLDLDAETVPGSYDDPWQLGHIEISQGDDGLQASFTDLAQTVELVELWPGAYTCPHPADPAQEMDVMFWPDADGNASHLVSRAGVAVRAQ
jgi:CubicO group peptidase (beta-lactamase class C family)